MDQLYGSVEPGRLAEYFFPQTWNDIEDGTFIFVLVFVTIA